jgi:hypothetical protein
MQCITRTLSAVRSGLTWIWWVFGSGVVTFCFGHFFLLQYGITWEFGGPWGLPYTTLTPDGLYRDGSPPDLITLALLGLGIQPPLLVILPLLAFAIILAHAYVKERRYLRCLEQTYDAWEALVARDPSLLPAFERWRDSFRRS